MKITIKNVSKNKTTVVLLGRTLAHNQTMEVEKDLLANPAIGRLVSSGLITALKPASRPAAPAPQAEPKVEEKTEEKDEGKRKGKKSRKSE
jgi:hypothetical protein